MNFNPFNNNYENNFMSNNFMNPSFIKDEQKFDICSFRFQEQIGIYNSYIEGEDNKEFFLPQKIFYDRKTFNTSKNMENFDNSLYNRNIDNKEHAPQKDITQLNKEKDSSDLVITNLISKKVKYESKIKDISLKNEKSKKYNITKDNIIRKCKNLLLSYIRKFINIKIKEIYNNDIGEGIWRKEILDINSEQKYDNKINSIKNLLNTTLKEIFSTDISLRFTSYLSNHNKEIIHRLLNENDREKREKFQKLFNITFSECLNKFINNSIDYEGLEGFPNFDDIKSDLNEDEEHLDEMKKYLIEFENIIKSKKSRNRTLIKNNLKNKKDNHKIFAFK